jgi:hypothetical protein
MKKGYWIHMKQIVPVERLARLPGTIKIPEWTLNSKKTHIFTPESLDTVNNAIPFTMLLAQKHSYYNQ